MQELATDLQYESGMAMSDVRFEVMASKGSETAPKRSKLNTISEIQNAINSESWKALNQIEELKLKLLKASNQNLSVKNGILQWSKIKNGKDQIAPFTIDFNRLISMNDKESVSQTLTKEVLNTLWNTLQNFRSKIIYHVGTYEWGQDSKCFTNDVQINSFKDNKTLIETFKKQIGKNINKKEDQQVLIDLYVASTYPEKVNNQSWMNHHFDNSTLIVALNTLTTLQINILKANKLALYHWSSKVSICDYSFDKIIPIIDGQSAGRPGDTLRFKAFFGAVETYNNPSLKVNYNIDDIDYKDGAAYFTIVIPKNQDCVNLSGQLSIKNKSGIIKREDWQHKIIVLH